MPPPGKGGDIIVPDNVVREAASHALRTGAPLLRYARADYARELVAWPTDEGYDLALGGWVPPTWREYADRLRRQAAVNLTELERVSRMEPDQPMPEEVAWQLLDESETELGEAYKLLAPFHGACFVRENGTLIGELEFVDAWYMSNHVVKVTAPSALVLSCLQYELDRRQVGIRIVLAEA